MSIHKLIRLPAIVCIIFLLAMVNLNIWHAEAGQSIPAQAPEANCTRTSVGFTPLMDLGTGTYLGYEGGLYPGAVDQPPEWYDNLGLQYMQQVQPLNSSGQPDPNGRIVLLSIRNVQHNAGVLAFQASRRSLSKPRIPR